MNFYIDYYKLGHIAGRLLFLIFIIGIAVAIIKKGKRQPEGSSLKNGSEPDFSEKSEISSESTDSKKPMTFPQAIKSCYRQYFSFRGCATRAEYWWFHLFMVAVSAAMLVPAFIALKSENYTVYLIFMVPLFLFTAVNFLPAFSVGVRRMHDTGNMGFLIIVPIANIINALLPSVESSEYKSGYNIHPVANFLGKAFVIFSIAYYVLFMGIGLTSVFYMSGLQGMDSGEYSSDYELSDEEDNSSWLEDNENSEPKEDSF